MSDSVEPAIDTARALAALVDAPHDQGLSTARVAGGEDARHGAQVGWLGCVDVATPDMLSTELVAPGGDPGRLVVFTKSALNALEAM